MKTQKQAVAYAKSLVGKQWDWDKEFGYQCFDLANFYWYYVTGRTLAGRGAVDIPSSSWNNFNGYATVYKNTPSFLAKPGDLVVFNSNYGGGWGHVAIVLSATLNQITVVEQNWLGGGWTGGEGRNAYGWEVATIRKHAYDFPMWFIRPRYAAEPKGVKKVVKPKPTKKAKQSDAPKFKPKTIVLIAGHGYNDPGAVGNGTNERDFIRKNIVPNVDKYLKQAGHKVIRYGGATMSQDCYQDTAYGIKMGNKKDYGLYWIKNKLKPDVIVEFHLDSAGPSASGGHVIKNKYAADNIDVGLQHALEESVGTIRGITTRTDLLNCNVAYELNVNYRLIEMGFITNKRDMDYIKNNLQSFTKSLATAIHGKPIGGTKASKPKRITWNWKGRFYPNTTIKVRRAPGLKGQIVDRGSWLYGKNDWVDFISVTKLDNYWWAKFKYPTNPSAGYFFCALTPITDKRERLKQEKKMYGRIAWK